MTNCITAIFAVCFGSGVAVCMAADETKLLVDRLKSEGPTAWQFLNAESKRWSFDVEVKYEGDAPAIGNNPPRSIKYDLNFHCLFLDRHALLDGKLEYVQKSERIVYLSNPHYYAQLSMQNDKWLLDKNGTTDNPDIVADLSQLRLKVLPATSFACPEVESVERFLNHPTTKLTGASRIGSSVRVTFERRTLRTSDNKHILRIGHLDFNDAAQWRLVGYRILDTEKEFDQVVSIQYDGVPSVAIGLSQQIYISTSPGGTARSITRYHNVRNTPNHESPFYLSHYGLPEPPGITPPSRPTPTYVWLLLAAGGFGVITLACRWLLKRRSKAVLPPPVPPTA